jgi:hypothetical protein
MMFMRPPQHGHGWVAWSVAGARSGGCGSATATLVQICIYRVNLAIDPAGLPQIPAPASDQSCAATSSANTLISVGCPHTLPSCANLHSARRSRRHRLPSPAGSFIEGFRTPATVQAASPRSAGIRNPQQNRKWQGSRGTSVLPSTADIVRPARHVRKVPRCDIDERCHTDAPMNDCGKLATSALRCIGRLPIQQNIVHPDFHRDFHVRVRQNIEAPVLHRVDSDPCDVGGG